VEGTKRGWWHAGEIEHGQDNSGSLKKYLDIVVAIAIAPI
jgi:hypothetical protein